jgi:hypothetical protein
VFLGYVELLVSHGVDKNTAFAIAEKGTETSMINYHPNERPMLYSKLGVLGQFAGGLTTYKHGSINALAHLTQEAKNPRKAIPIASAALVMLILAGITGTPGYQELDQLYSKISEHIKGEPSTIRQDFLKNIPEWVKSGAISSATNLNMQAKWSAADMVPDSLFKAASPHLEAAGQIVNKIVTYLSDPSETNKANLLMAASPSSLKGFTEEKFKKDSQGRVLDYQGLPKFTDPRSEENWNKRKYFGVGLLDETVKGEELYKQRQAQVFKEKKIAEKSKQVKQAYIDKDFMRGAKLMAEYEKLAGPEAQQALMQELMDKTLPVDTNLGQKERYQGTPKNLQGVKKYENYNKGN